MKPKPEEKQRQNVKSIILETMASSSPLVLGILLAVVGAVCASLLPPLVLEEIVNRLTGKLNIPFTLTHLYFGLIALSGILESVRESLLTVFGQRMTRSLRHGLCGKLSRLDTDTFVKQDPGAVTSRFVGDVDTVETLFTSGIISMAADLFKVISILAVIFVKNRGLALVLLVLLPPLFAFTRAVQKEMLKAQLSNRSAVAKVTSHVPETIRCIRTIHTLGKEPYMRRKYDDYIGESYQAMEKNNFYDSIYSPVILILNAVVVAAVLLLSATGNPQIHAFFGMSVGTAVAVVSYISQVFGPLESIGMEIQTIQSAVAGVRRINEFLAQPERQAGEESHSAEDAESWTDIDLRFHLRTPSVSLRNVSFGYDDGPEVLHNLNFSVESGEHLTLAGRTGAGKSTIFKLIAGLYRPRSGQVLIYGQNAADIPDSARRHLFGYVEQTFHMVPGSVADQITLFDGSITAAQVEAAARTAGLHETICSLPQGYDTLCDPSLFSQGQWQLLSIARAIAAAPEILLLDEITANLDADTEQMVLTALRSASENRTVLSISHRLYEQTGGRKITIG